MLSVRHREILAVALLLVATLCFGFILLPYGIGLGYGSGGAGLSPRFMPQLATTGIGLALAFGLFETIVLTEKDREQSQLLDQNATHPLRAAIVVLICLLFAHVGFELAGFYLGGVTMAALLIFLLGERKVRNVLLFPVIILIVIYLVFELGFQIRLPKAGFIPGLPV